MLHEVCKVEVLEARAIGSDILARAEAFAALDQGAQDIVTAPFIEDVVSHEPQDAPLHLKGAVAVVVRNSRLEDAHVRNLVDHSGIKDFTTMAVGPLSHLLAARARRPSEKPPGHDPFRNLRGQYPRAWASFDALVDAIPTGGPAPFRLPDGPVPELPEASATAKTSITEDGRQAMVISGIDPGFDDTLLAALRTVAKEKCEMPVSSLSQISRNSEKLHRAVEFVLGHGGSILTTNYLLKRGEVWVRHHPFVKPDSRNPFAGFAKIKGLVTAHREVVRKVARDLEEDGGQKPTEKASPAAVSATGGTSRDGGGT